MPRTIQELRDNAEHITKTERALMALADIPQPATARQISQSATNYNGLRPASIAKLLPRHPQVEKIDGRPVRYRIKEGE